MLRLLRLVPLLALLAGAGCAGGPPEAPPAPESAEVAALAQAIGGLGPAVDPGEAARAARIAFEHSRALAVEYGVTDPPLIHNTKVNLGLRPRGLCWQWAEDLQERLGEEDFRTLSLHRAIATPQNPFGGDHSTVVVSARGDTMPNGIVLDPWRGGGELFWSPVQADTRYDWRPRQVVLHQKVRRIRYERAMRNR